MSQQELATKIGVSRQTIT
ncbi:helix-turn-helix domain-containing protein, partial [Listeria monocytogenes]|nr:helix-turn-helix domain-containing protein [Listeria monocytogenes]